MCPSVVAQESGGDKLPAAAAAAPGHAGPQPITAAVPGLLMPADQRVCERDIKETLAPDARADSKK